MLLIALAFAVTGCSRGSFGYLVPEVSGGVERGSDSRSAIARRDGVTVTVSANWASEGEQTAELVLTNRRPTSLTIPICSALMLNNRLGDSPLNAAIDYTEQNYEDKRTDNDEPVVYSCYDYDRQKSLTASYAIPAGATRKLSLSFFNYADDKRQAHGDAASGDKVAMTLPIGTPPLRFRFVAE